MNDTSKLSEILIVSAEASSELYARRVIEECKRRNLNVRFFGIGSPEMQKMGCELIEESSKMAVVGLWEVLEHWNVISKAFKSLLLKARTKKPKLALLLDYPDFNLRLAAKLAKNKIPVFYYISPQVWAWRTGRVKLIKKIISKMLVVFPFEVGFYKNHNVDVSFVGHPLLDEIKNSILSTDEKTRFRAQHGAVNGEFVVGIMPGSRTSEVKYCFETQLRAAEMIAKEKLSKSVKFFILVAPTLDTETLKLYLSSNLNLNYVFIKDDPFKMIQSCDACIVASGTATLMTALMEVPMVIMYKMNALTARLARKLVSGKFFGMPNLISDQKIVPELFQEEAKPEVIAHEIVKYINNADYYSGTKAKLSQIKEKLGTSGAAVRVVDEISKVL